MNVIACRRNSKPCAVSRPMNALIAVCLVLSLTSCTPTAPAIALCPAVPAVLVQPTRVPELAPDPTWRDVAGHAVELRSAIGQCNFDKAQIRQWSDAGNTP